MKIRHWARAPLAVLAVVLAISLSPTAAFASDSGSAPAPNASGTEAPSPSIEPRATYTVAFDPDDGTTEFPDFYKTQVADGELVADVPPDPIRAGYAFQGWAHAFDPVTNKPIFWNFATMTVSENTTLWAVWSQVYTVAFDPDDGISEYPDFYKTQVVDGAFITNVPPNPQRDGYVFKGWAYAFDNATEEPSFWDFSTMPVSENTTLWAVWAIDDGGEPAVPGGNGGEPTDPLQPTTPTGSTPQPTTGAKGSALAQTGDTTAAPFAAVAGVGLAALLSGALAFGALRKRA